MLIVTHSSNTNMTVFTASRQCVKCLFTGQHPNYCIIKHGLDGDFIVSFSQETCVCNIWRYCSVEPYSESSCVVWLTSKLLKMFVTDPVIYAPHLVHVSQRLDYPSLFCVPVIRNLLISEVTSDGCGWGTITNFCITLEMYLYCVSVWSFSVLHMCVGSVGCRFTRRCVGAVICACCEATTTLQGAFDYQLPCSPSYTVSYTQFKNVYVVTTLKRMRPHWTF